MNKKLLNQYKKEIEFETRFYDNSRYYVGNVKLWHAFDYNVDVVAEKFKDNKTIVRDWLNKQSQEKIDDIFWDYICNRADDYSNFYTFDDEEVKDLNDDDKIYFVGRYGGWAGFEYDPEEICNDYKCGDIDDEQMKKEIKRLKTMNMIIDSMVTESKSMSVNDTIIDYIENNVIDDLIEEENKKKEFENIIYTNREMIQYTKDQYKTIGLDVDFKLIIK